MAEGLVHVGAAVGAGAQASAGARLLELLMRSKGGMHERGKGAPGWRACLRREVVLMWKAGAAEKDGTNVCAGEECCMKRRRIYL